MKVGAVEPRVPLPSSTPSQVSTRARPAENAEGPSPFAQVLHGLGHVIGSGEATMRTAMNAAHDLGPAELMALQAGVYRYSEAIDLASRLVDHATSDIKTVLQGAGQ
jgi:hypothetical protein